MARPTLARGPVLATAAVLALTGCDRSAAPTADPAAAVVAGVVDGDTIEVTIAGRNERVRLLGIDTPETVDPDRPVECQGPEASALTHQLLPDGTAVRLERDEEPRDRYGRLLAYVFRADDGLFVNEAILQAGEAEILSIAPNHAYAGRLAQAAEAARAAGAGLWGGCPADGQ